VSKTVVTWLTAALVLMLGTIALGDVPAPHAHSETVRRLGIAGLGLVLFVAGFSGGRLGRGLHGLRGRAFARGLAGTVAAILGLYLVLGGATERISSDSSPASPEGTWVTSYDQGVARAREAQKPMVVDCWAKWCNACLELMDRTFHDPRVEARLAGYVRVKLDMDVPHNEALWERFAIRGLPWVGLWTPGGELRTDLILTDFEGPDAFLSRLDKLERGEGGTGGTDIASRLKESGLFAVFLFVFGAGILVSFTPCVYPLIPVVLATIGAHESYDRPRRANPVALSAVLVLGMAMSYSALGVIAAASGGALGRLLQEPIFVGGISLVFVLMGLSYLGVFRIELPYQQQDRLESFKRRLTEGNWVFLAAFVVGALSGVTAAPCVGPVLVAILTYVSTTQDVFLGFWLLFDFALGMGLLFFALGASTGLLKKLPRSGAWMQGVEVVFALSFFVVSLYYLKTLVPWLRAPFPLLGELLGAI